MYACERLGRGSGCHPLRTGAKREADHQLAVVVGARRLEAEPLALIDALETYKAGETLSETRRSASCSSSSKAAQPAANDTFKYAGEPALPPDRGECPVTDLSDLSIAFSDSSGIQFQRACCMHAS